MAKRAGGCAISSVRSSLSAFESVAPRERQAFRGSYQRSTQARQTWCTRHVNSVLSLSWPKKTLQKHACTPLSFSVVAITVPLGLRTHLSFAHKHELTTHTTTARMLSTMSGAAARAARPVLARHMSAITGVNGRYIIDSRGNPTVEVCAMEEPTQQLVGSTI